MVVGNPGWGRSGLAVRIYDKAALAARPRGMKRVDWLKQQHTAMVNAGHPYFQSLVQYSAGAVFGAEEWRRMAVKWPKYRDEYISKAFIELMYAR
jgi:hypothetical protein